jgi:hypothetical protein
VVPKKRRRGKVPAKSIDAKRHLLSASVEGSQLRFRLRIAPDGGARPREVVEALLGHRLDDHRMRRVRLLAKDGEGFASFIPPSSS